MDNPRPMTPGATLDWEWDWKRRGWLKGDDVVQTVVMQPAPEIAVESSAILQSGQVVSAKLTLAAGLAEGTETWCDCWVTTRDGRKDKRRMRFVAQVR